MKKVRKKNSPNAVLTTSAAETRRLGEKLGRKLAVGDVVALSGPLGAGKTTLVQGLVRGAGSRERVSSPTYTLIHEYLGPLKIYHLDWYRLRSLSETDRRMAEECLDDDSAVTLIEWPERGKKAVPRGAIRVAIRHAAKGSRKISWKGIAP